MRLSRLDFESVRQHRFFIYILIVLLFIPKINLMSVGTYEGAGIRVDDIIILLIAPLIFFIMCKKGSISQVEFYFLLFFLSTIVSHILNLPFSRGDILYPLRIMEYWAFFYFGRFFTRKEFFLSILSAFIFYSAILITAQYLELIGGYSDGIYKPVLSKPTGSTNGSYEISMVLALIFPIFFLNRNNTKIHFYFLITAFLILLTQSRTALVMIGCSYFFWLMFLSNSSFFARWVTVCSIIGLVYIITIESNDLFVRFISLFTSDTYYALQDITAMAPSQNSGDGNVQFSKQQVLLKTGAVKSSLIQTVSSSADLSVMVRLNKWLWGFNSYLNQGALYLIFGIGGGVLGNALDGGLLRILIEFGIVGLTLFFLFLSKIVKRIASIEFVIVATFLLGNLFIDYYLSYKVTSVFFLILGFLYTHQKQNAN